MGAPENDNDKDILIAEQAKMIQDLEAAVKNQAEDAVIQDSDEIAKEWIAKLEQERQLREEKERWATELVKEMEKEKKVCVRIFVDNSMSDLEPQARIKLEGERRALAAFVSKFDSLGLGLSASTPKVVTSSLPPTPARLSRRMTGRLSDIGNAPDGSPLKLMAQPSLLDQMPEEAWNMDMSMDMSFELDMGALDQDQSPKAFPLLPTKETNLKMLASSGLSKNKENVRV